MCECNGNHEGDALICFNTNSIHLSPYDLIFIKRFIRFSQASHHPYAAPQSWCETGFYENSRKLTLSLHSLYDKIQRSSHESGNLWTVTSQSSSSSSSSSSFSSSLYMGFIETCRACLLDTEAALSEGRSILKWVKGPTLVPKPDREKEKEREKEKDKREFGTVDSTILIDPRLSRRRHRWRAECRRAKTLAQLSCVTSALLGVIDRDLLQKATQSMDRSKFTSQFAIPKSHLVDIPVEGDTLIYFAAAHAACEAQERQKMDDFVTKADEALLNLQNYVVNYSDSVAPPMWGGSDAHTLQRCSATLQCQVTSVRYFQGPGAVVVGGNYAMHPFAQIEMKVVPSTFEKPLHVLSQAVMEEGNNIRSAFAGHVRRILHRIINLILDNKESIDFVTVVSKKQCPDYLDIVTNPIDLTMIKKRISGGFYTALIENSENVPEKFYPSRFVEDITLMRDNCHLYCTGKYPDIVEASNTIFSYAVDLCDAFFKKEGSLVPPCNPLQTPISTSTTSTFAANMPTTLTVCVRLMDKNCPREVLNVGDVNHRIIPCTRFLMQSYDYELALKNLSTIHTSMLFKSDKYVLVHQAEEVTKNRQGVIVNTCDLSEDMDFLPWKWCHVEWTDLALWPAAINPWEGTSFSMGRSTKR